jgi:hypothetical protein
MIQSMSETHEDREGLILRNSELRKRVSRAVAEANVLRREVAAWRAWREGTGSLVRLLDARRETDRSDAFRCVGDD